MHKLGLLWWEPVHGFYAGMGGIVVRLNSIPRFLAKETGTTVEIEKKHSLHHSVQRSA